MLTSFSSLHVYNFIHTNTYEQVDASLSVPSVCICNFHVSSSDSPPASEWGARYGLNCSMMSAKYGFNKLLAEFAANIEINLLIIYKNIWTIINQNSQLIQFFLQ